MGEVAGTVVEVGAAPAETDAAEKIVLTSSYSEIANETLRENAHSCTGIERGLLL